MCYVVASVGCIYIICTGGIAQADQRGEERKCVIEASCGEDQKGKG